MPSAAAIDNAGLILAPVDLASRRETWATRDHYCDVCTSPHKLPVCQPKCAACGSTEGVNKTFKTKGRDGYARYSDLGGWYCRNCIEDRRAQLRWPAVFDLNRKFGDVVGAAYSGALATDTPHADLLIDLYRKGGLGLLIQGPVGTGKTHLAAAALRIWYLSGRTVEFTPSRRLFRMIRDTYRNDSEFSESQIVDRFTRADLLVLDDLGREGRITEQVQSVLHEVLDERIRDRRTTIVTTNLGDEIGAVYGDSIASRLALLVPVLVEGRDRRQG